LPSSAPLSRRWRCGGSILMSGRGEGSELIET
jgi:hypothetical protein